MEREAVVGSTVRVRCFRACIRVCWGLPGFILASLIPRRIHQTESFVRFHAEFPLAKGIPLSLRIADGSPYSLKACSKTGKQGLSSLLDSDSHKKRYRLTKSERVSG